MPGFMTVKGGAASRVPKMVLHWKEVMSSEMMSNGTTSQITTRLSLGLSAAFLALLTVLHVLEPEFNTGHLISEYQLGDYGILMSLAFWLLGGSALLLAVALGPRLHTRDGRTGRWALLAIGAAFLIAGVFPPVRTPVVMGYLHGMSGLVAIFGSPIAFSLIGRSIARSEAQCQMSRNLRWATLVTWGGLWFFLVSLVVGSLNGQIDTLPPLVSLANRLLVVTYCIWLMAAAWSMTRALP